MNGIFGIIEHEGREAAAENVQALRRAMARRAGNEGGTWLGRVAALGLSCRPRTGRETRQSQPLVFEQGEECFVLVADVRLDNRAELHADLKMYEFLRGRALADTSDAELVLAAHLAWEEAAPSRLLGDFAYALWDARRGILLCVRDPLGVKPLYYHETDERFVFANDIRGLADSGLVPRDLDETALGLFLLDGELLHPRLTFRRDVCKLPPAMVMRVSGRKTTLRSYWDAEASQEVRYPEATEYAGHLRELLEKAVRSRMCEGESLACHLSGGLDSGVVSVLAAREQGRNGPPLVAYSWAPPPGPAGQEDFEWAWSRATAGQAGVALTYIDLAPPDVLAQLRNVDLAWHSSADSWYELPWRKSAGQGVQAILSGWGGDELSSYSGRLVFTEAAARGRWLSALAGLYGESREKPGWPRRFAGAVRREMVRPFLASPRFKNPNALLQCARPEFSEFTRKLQPQAYALNARSVRDEQLALLRQGHLQNRLESWANAGRQDGIEYRFPLLDRRLVEFALGLPPEIYRRKGATRWVFREAARGLLPEPVREQTSKQEPRRVQRLLESFEQALPAWQKDLASDDDRRKRYLENPYIDLEEVERRITTLPVARADAAAERIAAVTLLMKSIQVLGAGDS